MGQKNGKAPQIQSDLAEAVETLPDEIAWSFRHCVNNVKKWSFKGTSTAGCFQREIPENSEDFKKVKQLMSQLGGDDIPIEKVRSAGKPVYIFLGYCPLQP